MKFYRDFSDTLSIILADWKAAVSPKNHLPTFAQTLEVLRAHSFTVTDWAGVAGSVLVTKQGAGAVLIAAPVNDAPPVFAVAPGVLIAGRVARLLDRGYQKFLKTEDFELPATASQLQAIHSFSEELKLLTGAADLFNEALGTTSDLYRYDRLQGREATQPAALRPWEQSGGH